MGCCVTGGVDGCPAHEPPPPPPLSPAPPPPFAPLTICHLSFCPSRRLSRIGNRSYGSLLNHLSIQVPFPPSLFSVLLFMVLAASPFCGIETKDVKKNLPVT